MRKRLLDIIHLTIINTFVCFYTFYKPFSVSSILFNIEMSLSHKLHCQNGPNFQKNVLNV
jgi:hypothetical protein